MIQFEYIVLIRGSVHMFGLLCVHQKREDISPSFFVSSVQGSTPPLTNLITHPLCFLTASCSDVTSQLFSWERGGASDVKNPDPYYSRVGSIGSTPV